MLRILDTYSVFAVQKVPASEQSAFRQYIEPVAQDSASSPQQGPAPEHLQGPCRI